MGEIQRLRLYADKSTYFDTNQLMSIISRVNLSREEGKALKHLRLKLFSVNQADHAKRFVYFG